ncbi:MAG: helicase HerA-like domain-containing protein [Cyanobium sp.]
MADAPLLIAADCAILPAMACRHGLIAGATGTGKTVTLQRIVEQFSALGVPVLLADVKGDLAGMAAPGGERPAFAARLAELGLPPLQPRAFPLEFWDVAGERGLPLRATVSDLGPLLLARLLELNEVQAGVLSVVFKLADDQGLLLLDLKDLRALLRHVGENARTLQLEYGSIAAASVSAIQRALLRFEEQGAEHFLSEPSLDPADLLRRDGSGAGLVHVLMADRLIHTPKLYAMVLLWLLSELHERLPERGELERPELLLVFDEAHLLFDGAPPALLERIERVVRLIRSKGVSLWFCSQSPTDLPEKLLGQLGHRVQHALRAYTPAEQRRLRAVAEGFRASPGLDTTAALGELAVGEALVSFLDAQGAPLPVRRALVVPPQGRVGTLEEAERQRLVDASPLGPRYRETLDRESAYELLQRRAEQGAEEQAAREVEVEAQRQERQQARERERVEAQARRERDRLLLSVAGEVGQALGGRSGRSLARGVLGGLLGRSR